MFQNVTESQSQAINSIHFLLKTYTAHACLNMYVTTYEYIVIVDCIVTL